jgi:2'-5' RNA ligase
MRDSACLAGIEELVDAFEAGVIANDGFPHEKHVKVAWGLVRRYGREEGYARLARGIRGIASQAGRPQVFHVTITRAWFELISMVDDLADHPELFDKTLIGRYYSPARLEAGREVWLDPDLRGLQ